jgi:hypothetical protein
MNKGRVGLSHNREQRVIGKAPAVKDNALGFKKLKGYDLEKREEYPST